MNLKNPYPLLFSTGALGYGGIEILWRGNTHWSMLLTGGACLVLLYIVDGKLPELSYLKKCLFGAFTITGMEFVVGCGVNLGLKLDVWDYSKEAFNFMGQVCLLYVFLWFLLCLPLFKLCGGFRRYFAKKNAGTV
ncbi:MAG: hypothetical protein Q4G07_06615 [Oscillospiraceae bacterium]|nr:hypothetical protein [Oscillospiraceae bacterium]